MKNLNSFGKLAVGMVVDEANSEGLVIGTRGVITSITEEVDTVWVTVAQQDRLEATSEYAFRLVDGEPLPFFEEDTIEDLVYLVEAK